MENEILLYGEIGDDPGLDASSVKYLIAAADPDEELVVRIDSPGGSVFQAFSIYEAIASFPGPTRAVIESTAMSAASYIAMACDVIEIASNGTMMLHNPHMSVDGDDEGFTRAAGMLAKIKESMIAGYAARTRKPRSKILELMKAETYYNAEEAVRERFADSITGSGVVRARWVSAMASARSQGLSGHSLVMAVDRSHPGLREQYVREANAERQPSRRPAPTPQPAATDGEWALWSGLVRMHRTKGLSFDKAVAKVDEQDPGLRLRAVAEKNAR